MSDSTPKSHIEEPMVGFTYNGPFRPTTRACVFSFDQAAQVFGQITAPDAVLCVSVPNCQWTTDLSQAKRFFDENAGLVLKQVSFDDTHIKLHKNLVKK